MPLGIQQREWETLSLRQSSYSSPGPRSAGCFCQCVGAKEPAQTTELPRGLPSNSLHIRL